jgi:hypothetical protein
MTRPEIWPASGNVAMTGRGDTWLVVLLAPLSAILALAIFGPIWSPDTGGYVEYAQQILLGTIPSGEALLHGGPEPISLFRAPGYPALLAGLQWLFPDAWRSALVMLQIAATTVIAAATHRTALRLGAGRVAAIAAALLPATGFAVVMQIAILTDALNAVLFTGAALALAAWRGAGAAVLAGVLLAAATTIREATPIMAVAFLPLAWMGARPLARMLATMVPSLLVLAALMGWNHDRIGRWVVTTTAETQLVYPLVPLLRHGVPVYAGDDQFDRVARETVGRDGFAGIGALHDRMFQEAGMTAPELSAAATARYFRAWRDFPLAMLRATVEDFRVTYLEMPFQPLDTAANLVVYAEPGGSPDFVKLDRLWQHSLRGNLGAMLLIVLIALSRAIGIGIALAGLVLPWLPGRGWPARGLWMICVGLVGVYLPVHLEPRYMVPVVPLLCIAAAASLRPAAVPHEALSV